MHESEEQMYTYWRKKLELSSVVNFTAWPNAKQLMIQASFLTIKNILLDFFFHHFWTYLNTQLLLFHSAEANFLNKNTHSLKCIILTVSKTVPQRGHVHQEKGFKSNNKRKQTRPRPNQKNKIPLRRFQTSVFRPRVLKSLIRGAIKQCWHFCFRVNEFTNDQVLHLSFQRIS